MVIGGSNIGMALVQHQTGQGNPAAYLQDPQPLDLLYRHQMGQHGAGRPDDAEQWPGGGRDAQFQRDTIHIGIFLVVAQGAQVNIGVSKL